MLGNKKDYSAFLCPGAESLALAAPTGTNTVASGAEPLSVLKACPAPGTGIAGDLVEGMSPEELSRQMNGLADWFRVGFECVDFQVDVKNCGGCAAFGTGYVSSRALYLVCVFLFVTDLCPCLTVKTVPPSPSPFALLARKVHAMSSRVNKAMSLPPTRPVVSLAMIEEQNPSWRRKRKRDC